MTSYTPPHNIDAEEIVLGTILLRGAEFLAIASQYLTADDFYYPKHKKIYAACIELENESKAIDLTTALLKLQHFGDDFQVKLADLVGRLHIAYNFEACCEEVREKSNRRKLMGILLEAQESVLDPSCNYNSIIQETLEIILDLSKQDSKGNGLRNLEEVIPETVNDIEALNTEDNDLCLNTDMLDLDNLTGGLQKGMLTVLAGRAGSGKSTVALEMAMNLAKAGKRIAIFSLEMSAVQIGKKIIVRLNRDINPNVKITVSSLMRSRGLSHIKDFDWLASTVEPAMELDIWIDDNSSASVGYIRREIANLAAEGKMPDVVIVDYVGLMGNDNKHSNRVLELDATLKALRAMAKDLNIAMLGLAQINRAVESRQDKRPGLADIRESGGYEQEAALVIGIFNPRMYKEDADKILELIVLKNRFGATGKAIMGFEPECNRLYNLA